MADTDTVTKPELNETNTGDHDKFSHYYRKRELEQAWIAGHKIQALCGKWDIPMSDPDKYTVCPMCKDIFENVVGKNRGE